VIPGCEKKNYFSSQIDTGVRFWDVPERYEKKIIFFIRGAA